ncbi:hypothetical protein ceV_477 [Chrysochromulina ericina virus CeV-01B]|uniref:Uncharacterized protein n=1 Tax=Chrysochromulina ericina virus CeV-01B TaxID=3070830 RepID=A0A0N9R439_9VIRU|nr:hypothetical protein ceV_477 [Chrysochromulina ericina virus]ALH23383.1 hypothetical protein ceV_477 [Chrysochromulina ericina virus CeV-01B]
MIGGARRTRRGGRSRRRGGMRGSQNLALNALLTGMVLSRGKKRKGKKSRRLSKLSRRGGRTRRR